MNEHAHIPIVVALPRVGVPYAMRRDPDYTIREENATGHRLPLLWPQGSVLQENDETILQSILNVVFSDLHPF
jgi:hypothetical protein